MKSLGTLTPAEAEAMGVPRSVSVISPAYRNRSRASPPNKSGPSSSGKSTPEQSQPSEASNSAPDDPMVPAIDSHEEALQAKLRPQEPFDEGEDGKHWLGQMKYQNAEFKRLREEADKKD